MQPKYDVVIEVISNCTAKIAFLPSASKGIVDEMKLKFESEFGFSVYDTDLNCRLQVIRIDFSEHYDLLDVLSEAETFLKDRGLDRILFKVNRTKNSFFLSKEELRQRLEFGD